MRDDNILKLLYLIICLVFCQQSIEAQELKIDYFTSSFDITASQFPRQDVNGVDCAMVKVLVASSNASFEGNVIGDVAYSKSEYKVYMSEGSKFLTIKLDGFLPLKVVFKDYEVGPLQSKSTYILKLVIVRNDNDISEFKKKNIYIEPQIQLGGMTAFGASIGGYVNHLNVEAVYMMGLSESEEVFWNNTNNADAGSPVSYTYKPSFFGGKVGYAFYIGRPFRITPQVGVGVVSLSGTESQKSDNKLDAKNGYALNASASVKIDYLIQPWLGVGISPEYSLTLSMSDLYERVADVSSKVDGFAKGFNVRIGVYVTF